MGAKNARGVWVPAAGDGLLEGWATAAKQGGVYLSVASVAAARTALDLAAAAGMGATTSNPMLFLVGSGVQKVAYVSDGTKSNSVWVLAPLNEVEVDEKSYTTGVHASLTQFKFSAMITSDLPARPYDRIVTATGYAYGQVTAGRVNLGLRIGTATDQAEARFDPSDPCAVSVANSGIIRANTAPVIQLGVVGDHASISSSIQLGTSGKLSRLVVTAYPITMSE